MACVIREVDGGLQVINVNLPAVVSADLRLNEPRYASLPNIMKAKKKPLEERPIDSYGISLTPRLEVLTTKEPNSRESGKIVGSVDELLTELKQKGAV